ncbi:hypothetical protein BJX62DRAFT_136200 [Aspergillus germanicus]
MRRRGSYIHPEYSSAPCLIQSILLKLSRTHLDQTLNTPPLQSPEYRDLIPTLNNKLPPEIPLFIYSKAPCIPSNSSLETTSGFHPPTFNASGKFPPNVAATILLNPEAISSPSRYIIFA